MVNRTIVHVYSTYRCIHVNICTMHMYMYMYTFGQSDNDYYESQRRRDCQRRVHVIIICPSCDCLTLFLLTGNRYSY